MSFIDSSDELGFIFEYFDLRKEINNKNFSSKEFTLETMIKVSLAHNVVEMYKVFEREALAL
jgi:hypothetical protein